MNRFITSAMVLVLLASFGCSSLELTMSGADSGGFEDLQTTSLNLNVVPSDATPDIKPQTFRLSQFADWTDVLVQLRPTVELHGQVSAFVPTPFLVDPTVPGDDDAPIEASISLYQREGIAQASTSSGSDGEFSLSVPAEQVYRLLVIPEDTDQSPFLLVDLPMAGEDDDLGTIKVDHGLPIWGQVRYDDGTIPTDMTVGLLDATDGARGTTVSPDEDGWFMLRALPGSYSLVAAPVTESMNPTQVQTIELEADATEGLQVEFNLGSPTRYRVAGSLVDEDGDGLGATDDYLVRARAIRLDDTEGSFLSETRVDQHGDFNLDVMSGSYTLEVIPAYEAERSPVSLGFEVEQSAVELGEITIPPRIQWSGQVINIDGAPVPDALVVAREKGFDRYTYSATTGSDGVVLLDLPDVDLELTLTPPDASSATTFVELAAGQQNPSLMLDVGIPVEGTLDLDGEVVPFALIEIVTTEGKRLGTAISDGEGRFSTRVQSTLLKSSE